MIEVDYIAQPISRTTLQAVESTFRGGDITSLQVAAAYITSGGVEDLVDKISAAMGSAWSGLEKKWLTSFDYCRTDPPALEELLSTPSSLVRVHDAEFCLNHEGTPRVPFHPKAFLIQSNQRDYALAGSGNLSRSGLAKGIEAGLVIGVNRIGTNEPTSLAAVQALRTWYLTTWNSATRLDAALLAKYTRLYDSVANLKNPVPTEDDVASTDVGNHALSSKDLLKLRACRNFWIEAGNITKNRGPNLPGNQLMMKRLSRVFFGFNAGAVPENTTIGAIGIHFGGRKTGPYTLSYSDNKMDKLNLPIPGSDGPPTYDNKYLLFHRIPKGFSLTVGTPSEKTKWLTKSRAIEGAFKMTGSGREWGVF